MVAFFITTLALSIVGMSGLIVLKRYELHTGHVLWARVRPGVGGGLHRVLLVCERIPELARRYAHRAFVLLRTGLHRAAAWVVLLVEEQLERLLTFLRFHTRTPHTGSEASSTFLREVAEHKKELLKRSQEERVIVDE